MHSINKDPIKSNIDLIFITIISYLYFQRFFIIAIPLAAGGGQARCTAAVAQLFSATKCVFVSLFKTNDTDGVFSETFH